MEESDNNNIVVLDLKNEFENFENNLINKKEGDKNELLIEDNFEENKEIDNKNEDILNEERQLLKNYEEDKEEKKNLVNILNKISNKLTTEGNENKTFDEIYNEISNEEKFNINSLVTIKKEKSAFSLFFYFYFLLPFLIIINLSGIFQSITKLNSISTILKNSIKYYFVKEKFDEKYSKEDKFLKHYETNYNFYQIFFKESLKNSLDFNLIMLSNFIGFILLRFIGFYLSSFILLSINLISFSRIANFNFMEIDRETYNYSISQIFFLLFCYLICFIGVGSSSLLSQKILICHYSTYYNYLNQKEEIEENKKASIKKELYENKKDPILIDDLAKKNENLYKKFLNQMFKSKSKDTFNYIIVVSITTILGYFLRYIANFIIIKNKITYDSNYNITFINQNNQTSFNKTNIEFIYTHDNYLFKLATEYFYVFSVTASILIYCIFTAKVFEVDEKKGEKIIENINLEKKKNININIYKIFGFTIYKQNIIKKKENIPTCECLQLCCKSFSFCYDEVCCNKENNNNYDNCCCELNDISYNKNEECFCYCYQERRFCDFFKRYITSDIQKIIIPKMLIFFVLQLTTIGFERIHNDNEINFLEINNIEIKEIIIPFIVFLIGLILFFSISIGYGMLSSKEEDLLEYKMQSRISISMFKGIDGILYFNSIYSFCHSINYFREKDFISNSKYYIDIPFLMNKFYFFILTYFYLACSEAQKGWEIISGETLISIYISLWTLFYNLIRDNLSVTFLVIIQMIPSLFYFYLFGKFIYNKTPIIFGSIGLLSYYAL